MERNASGANVSIEEVATLARLAGLEVSRERLERLRVEFEAAMIAAAELEDAAGREHGMGIEPFDAAWPKGNRR